jgi:hypothetical protein
MRDGDIERAIETTTLRTILSVVQELGANPNHGPLIAGAVERKLKPDTAQLNLALNNEAAR